jgi:nucleotide-binding universal stress UspA family protein
MSTGPRSTGPRIIVGVDGSYGSMEALRVAVAEARRRQCPLVVAHALEHATGAEGWQAAEKFGYQVIEQSLAEALGTPPTDLEMIQSVVEFVSPGRALVYLSTDPGDLIVVGAKVVRRLRWLRRSGTDTYCVRHSACPVLVVPPPDLLRLVRTSRRERRDWQRGIADLVSGAGSGAGPGAGSGTGPGAGSG